MATAAARLTSQATSDPVPMIRALCGATNTTVRDLGVAIGLTEPAISRRMKGRIPWRAHELVQIAEHFDVTVGTLYRDPLESLKTRSEYLPKSRSRHLSQVSDNPNPKPGKLRGQLPLTAALASC